MYRKKKKTLLLRTPKIKPLCYLPLYYHLLVSDLGYSAPRVYSEGILWPHNDFLNWCNHRRVFESFIIQILTLKDLHFKNGVLNDNKIIKPLTTTNKWATYVDLFVTRVFTVRPVDYFGKVVEYSINPSNIYQNWNIL